MHGEIVNAQAGQSAGLITSGTLFDMLCGRGMFFVQHLRENEVIFEEEFPNLVTTVGKNELLDKFLAGSAYTAVAYMGLKGAGTPVLADTMASHATWSEVGGANAPTYSGVRKTPAWSSAASGVKSTSAASSFTIGSTGTVAGCFIVMNSGASTTIDNTGGVLFSAGDFTAGSRSVIATDVLNVSYSLTV